MTTVFKALTDKKSKQYIALLERYVQLEEEFEQAKNALFFRGKTLTEANNDQAQWPIYVNERYGELKNISKKLQGVVDMVRGDIARELKGGTAFDVGRDIAKFIDRDERFLAANETLLMFDELLEKYQALSDAWTTRGYAVRNKVDILVHEIKDNLM